MSAFLLSRAMLRRQALGAGIGLSVSSMLALRQPRMRMDAHSSPRAPTRAPEVAPTKESRLDPDMLRQLSGGSVTGLLAGLLVSVFSKTLVLILGASVVVVQIAAKYGVDLVSQLRVRQRLQDSKVLAALRKDPAFKLSFGFFFAMSAFMSF